LREKLGESLSSLQKFDTPIEQATTSSLEALKAFSQADSLRDRGEEVASADLYQRAVELDPNFAMAYARLGNYYNNNGEQQRAAQYMTKAFEMRDRVSEHERLYITAHYYGDTLGDLERQMQTYELYKQTFPRDSFPWNNLALGYMFMGKFDQAIENGLQAIKLAPNSHHAYGIVMSSYAAENRFAEALQIFDQARAAKVDSSEIHWGRFLMAVAQGDEASQQRELAWSASRPDAQILFTGTLVDMARSRGQLRRSRELLKDAIAAIQRLQLREAAASRLADAATAEALIGDPALARRQAADALAQDRNQTTVLDAADTAAILGDAPKAEALTAEMQKRFPSNSLINKVRVPATGALIELRHNNPQKAVELLETAKPYDGTALGVIYVRAEAYRRAGQLPQAIAEYERILHLDGWAPTDVGIPLARLGLARIYAQQGDSAKARTTYQDLFAQWKDADPDFAPLVAAKGEYAKLK
jgi:pentatricopeptide repeat protein